MQLTNITEFQKNIGRFADKAKDIGTVFVVNENDYTKSFVAVNPEFFIALLSDTLEDYFYEEYLRALKQTYSAAKRKQAERYKSMSLKAKEARQKA